MIFIKNKYTTWYYSIIHTAKNRSPYKNTYYERHHIIPKSLGGNNGKDNLVRLTAREHYICHLLLTKMTEGSNKHRMLYAITAMSCNILPRIKFNSKLFQRLKIEANIQRSKNLTGKLKTESHKASMRGPRPQRCGINNSYFGKNITNQYEPKLEIEITLNKPVHYIVKLNQ